MGVFCTAWFPGHYLPSGAAIKWIKNIGSKYNRLDRFHNAGLHGTAWMVNFKREDLAGEKRQESSLRLSAFWSLFRKEISARFRLANLARPEIY